MFGVRAPFKSARPRCGMRGRDTLQVGRHRQLRDRIGGLVFLVVIFMPAFLLVVGALPFWDELRQRDAIRAAMAGVNAGVVAIQLAAA